MEEQAQDLARAAEEALPGWVERCVERVLVAYRGVADAAAMDQARAAGRRAAAEVGPALRALLEADVDEQRTTPLALLRQAVRYPTEVLHGAGVPPVVRDRFVEERFPHDPYDLTPATFADVDPSLHEPGLAWGAAKAWVVTRRHGGGRRGPG